jgi:transposase
LQPGTPFETERGPDGGAPDDGAEGPDPTRNKVVRWRCADLRAELASRWSVSLAERTIGKLLRRLRMTRLQPRPCHPKKDAAAQEDFKKRIPG